MAQHEQTLRAARDRLASLTAAVPGVVYQRMVRPDGDIRYTYISEGARELFGVSPEEILSDPDALFRRHGPEYRAKFRERLQAASDTLTMWDVEATIVAPDGSKKYTHAVARPDRQTDGSVLWTGIILDETRTREALVDSLSQGFLLFDAEDKLVLHNSHFVALFPFLAQSAVPGVRYEEIVLAEIAGQVGTATEEARQTPAFRERMRRHEETGSVIEQQLANDRWILVSEQQTREGGTVVLYTDISELRRRERDLRHLAFHDTLTGLPNRALFQERVEQATALSRSRGTTVTVLCIDVDHFKSVNDTLGHAAGDALLRSIAERLSKCCRDTDTVARLGGDEFGIVLTDIDGSDTVTIVAWRLLNAVSQPLDFNGHHVVSSISVGIASSATDGRTEDELIKKADLALYRAKADGRGTFRFFETEMDAVAQARRRLEVGLREALALDQLELHYQPQIDVSTDQVVGFEALVRWRHPERGLIPPGEFIPLAEETGIIVQLGEWVLRRACADALTWPAALSVAVNVSPAQFRHRNLTPLVAKVLKDTGLPADRLELEITESLLLRDIQANLVTLRSLKDLGVRISMDDFGTGYSSLGNLRSFPFDKIKIDRSFVSDMEHSKDAAAIVHAVLGLGHSLGMSTCAEGVETKEQLAYLRQEGCTEVQGFYYSKPRSSAEVARMIQAVKDGRLSPADFERWPSSGPALPASAAPMPVAPRRRASD
jgi:diguanylate cyclase (GGDEF)-like protein